MATPSGRDARLDDLFRREYQKLHEERIQAERDRQVLGEEGRVITNYQTLIEEQEKILDQQKEFLRQYEEGLQVQEALLKHKVEGIRERDAILADAMRKQGLAEEEAPVVPNEPNDLVLTEATGPASQLREDQLEKFSLTLKKAILTGVLEIDPELHHMATTALANKPSTIEPTARTVRFLLPEEDTPESTKVRRDQEKPLEQAGLKKIRGRKVDKLAKIAVEQEDVLGESKDGKSRGKKWKTKRFLDRIFVDYFLPKLGMI